MWDLIVSVPDHCLSFYSEMNRFFSMFQIAASCSKWIKIRLGHRFVRCPSGHHPWTIVVLIVY